ncbi:MAG TPA: hypothetical protein VGG72_11620 [Bryobacteraceae bacterium]|jgi:type II secretory pathway component GspD/PulD (secretin)
MENGGYTKTIGIIIAGLLASAMFGQAPALQNREFHLVHATTVQDLQELANGVRVLSEVRDMSTDNAQMSLEVRGTAEQIGLVEWLVKQLDQPVGGEVPGSPEYKGLSDTDENKNAITDGVARIFYFPLDSTTQEFQETANAIRTITETRRVATYNAGKAMMVRGTPAQIGMVEWLAQAMNKPDSPGGEYRVGEDDVMRVLAVANAASTQDFQEIANTARAIAEIRRVATVNTPHAILIRSTPNQMAMAQWLVTELDKPGGVQRGQASSEFNTPGSADDQIGVLYVANARSVDFQDVSNAIRTGAQIRLLIADTARRAVAVRGTASQIALAERLVHDLDVPSK